MTKIDEYDKKILRALGIDARLSVEKVSEIVNLSATPVRRRIRRLEREGVIKRYTIDVDLNKCGYSQKLFVFIKLQSRDQATIADFEGKVLDLPEVTSCSLVSGPHDYILTLRHKDMDTYNKFLREVLSELPGVFGIETSVVIGSIRDELASPLPSRG
jgi:Lrp/AsnC family leucine-responsive transcriptional regulator